MSNLRLKNQLPQISSIEDLLKGLPTEIYQSSNSRGVVALLWSIAFCFLGYIGLMTLPYISWPFLWLFLGATFVGLTSVMHDCRKGSFSSNYVINNIVGHTISLPLMLPFNSWRLLYRNNSLEGTFTAISNRWTWWCASFVEGFKSNFGLCGVFRPGDRLCIIFSLVSLYIFGAIFFTTMYYYVGIWGILKFWLFPYVAYHLWMSTFISITYKISSFEDSQVMFDIQFPCKYPAWLEIITNDINYVLAGYRTLSSGYSKKITEIPNHNIRTLFTSLQETFTTKVEQSRENLPEIKCPTFSFELLKELSNRKAPTRLGSFLGALSKVNWTTAIYLVMSPSLAIYGLFTIPIQLPTMLFSFICYVVAGLGITVGYHRLYAHRTYDGVTAFKLFILTAGTSAFEGSCLWWCKDHRAHHRFVDTNKDPYNINKGFFWAHVGWLLVKQDTEAIGKLKKNEIADLENDPILQFQDKYYNILALFSGMVFPLVFCGLVFNDWWGGFFFATMLKATCVNQSTFFINSLAHYIGERTFDDVRSPRDCWWVSIVTFGEGYHNFHHQFPYDYRNGITSFAFDPSKWLIYISSIFGLTKNLKRFPDEEIRKCAIQMRELKLENDKKDLDWGPDLKNLPEFTRDQVTHRVKEHSSLLIIDGIVFDVLEFMSKHPGGINYIKSNLGKDVTEAFNGGVYDHSRAARNMLKMLAVGKITENGENKDS